MHAIKRPRYLDRPARRTECYVARMLRRTLFFVALLLSMLVVVSRARAETVQAPAGGKAVPVGDGKVACSPLAGGWTIDAADPRLVHPPAGDEGIGTIVEAKTATSVVLCGAPTGVVSLVAIGRVPTLDATATTIVLDEGRLEIKGKRLKGIVVDWTTGKLSGSDTCADATADGASEKCAVKIAQDVPVDPKATSITVRPAGARIDPAIATYDLDGKRVASITQSYVAARTVVTKLLQPDAAADVTTGSAQVPLVHAEAVASADCVGATCEVVGNALVVRGVTSFADKLTVKLHLLPHVFLRRADVLDPTPSATIDLLHCPLSIATGAPFRDVDDARVVVKLEGRCASSAGAVRWTIDGSKSEPIKTVTEGDAAFVLLRAGRLVASSVTIQAVRADDSVIAVARSETRSAPHPHAVLELKDVGPIDFLPTNRAAVVDVPSIDKARLVVLPIDGVYDVTFDAGATHVRGIGKTVGFVSLRYGVRAADPLPASLAGEDLAVIADSLALPIHEANVPAPIGVSTPSAKPIVELLCLDGDGAIVAVKPGDATHVPFSQRDSCRFVFHRENVPVEDGAQKLTLDVDVTRVDGTPRPEAHVHQDFVIRPGGEQRLAWIKGVEGSFDRVTVRISHSADESHYVGDDLRTNAPASQWSVIMGTGHARIYATTAIPTGLYRVSDRPHSGILALNFGVLMRLTWLDSEGHEGVLGLESGVMGVGLANDTSSSGQSLTQVASVTGLGISVPIANRSLATETSVNLHAWFEYEVSRAWGKEPGNPVAFVFGPSISIGNIGANL